MRLLYGSGMRVLEALRLRVKDVELSRCEIVVRDGKGAKDRVTVLPRSLVPAMRAQLARLEGQALGQARNILNSTGCPGCQQVQHRRPLATLANR